MKTEWINDFAEDLVTATIWDHVPHDWGKWDSYQKWNYLNKRHMTILDCHAGKISACEVTFLCAWRPEKLCRGACDRLNVTEEDLREKLSGRDSNSYLSPQ